MSMQTICGGSCGAIWRWEEASESLTNALASYQRSCAFLESSIAVDSADSKDLASQIDASLKTFHVKIANELVHSRLVLVRMRNKILSRFYSLPKQILAQIFMEVVHVPSTQSSRSMSSHLNRVYTRLHSFLSVCTTWRNVGIAHKPLWSIIPIYEGWSRRSKHLAPRLSIDRSTASRYHNTGIHLAALVSSPHGFTVPSVDGRNPKFDTINIMSELPLAILHSLHNLFKLRGTWPTYQRLSELSIYQLRKEHKRTKGPKEYPDIFYDCVMYSMADERSNPILGILKSLSILRVRGAVMLWDRIQLSNLVELRFQSINFCSDVGLLDFLQAVNSAPELRDLKIISVIAFLDESSDEPSQSVECPMPKLQTLLLQDLDYNVLQILQSSFAPGSYRTTLCLTEKAACTHKPRKAPGRIDIKDLCKVLKRINVDKLVLHDDSDGKRSWLDHTELRSVLQSMSIVKTLIMSYWKFHKEDLLALERPKSGGKGNKSSPVRFPNLTALYLDEVQILEVEVLKKVVTSHKLRNMSLSGSYRPKPRNDPDSDIDVDTDGSSSVDDFRDWRSWDSFGDGDKIIKWLKTQVRQFLTDVPEAESRDYDTSEWELW